MGSIPVKTPLVVIVGETASGKSALAMEIARKHNGEIICADSRTVYRGMDIGTAKPSAQDRAEIPHHLLDVVEPGERFTVADFKQLAERSITDISARGKLPIMVGGTGLYVDSVLYDYKFGGSEQERDEKNPRHLKKTNSKVTNKLRPNTLVLGLAVERDALERRVKDRVEQMVKDGFEDEVEGLIDTYGEDIEALKAPGYKAFAAYMRGELNLEQAKQQFVRSDLQLAKRQRTWFKRNKSIQWVTNGK
jgi:tRNA dimethylallyltransferase